MTGIKNLSEMYDLLYEQADKVLKRHDLCQFIDGRCIRNRKTDAGMTREGCCRHTCVHLRSDGCKTKALRCKTFLCDYLKLTPSTKTTSALVTRIRHCLAALDVIESLSLRIFNRSGFASLEYFQSKEEFFKKYNGMIKGVKKEKIDEWKNNKAVKEGI